MSIVNAPTFTLLGFATRGMPKMTFDSFDALRKDPSALKRWIQRQEPQVPRRKCRASRSVRCKHWNFHCLERLISAPYMWFSLYLHFFSTFDVSSLHCWFSWCLLAKTAAFHSSAQSVQEWFADGLASGHGLKWDLKGSTDRHEMIEVDTSEIFWMTPERKMLVRLRTRPWG